MSRVRSDDYDDKKQHILNQASELFAEKGFQDTSMNDLANACGGSKSNIYHYFSSKEELLYCITSSHVKSLYVELASIAALDRPIEERFKSFVTYFVKKATESRNEHLVLMKDTTFLPEHHRNHVLNLERQIVEVLLGLLEKMNPGLLEPVKLRKPYAMLIFGMLIWTFTWYKQGGPISSEELALRVSDLILYGIKGDRFS